MDGTVINLCDSDSDSDDSLLGLGKRFKPASREKQLDKNMNSTTLHTSTHTSNTQIAVPQHEAKTSIINSEHLGERSPTTNQTMVDLPRNSDTDDDDSSQEFAHLPVYRPKINLSQGSNSSGVADDNANTNTNIQCSRKDNQDKDDCGNSDCSVIEILDETLDETTMNMHSSFAHTLGIQKPVTTTTTTTATEVSLSRNNSSSSSSPNSKKHESVLAIAKRPRNEQLPPSPNRDNEKSETDCIILLSSDDELQTPNFKSKSKSNSNRYTALKRLQDLSDSDDDELMSSAPFLQSTLHRDKKVCLPSSSNDESQTSAFGQERSGCNSPIGLGAQWQSPRGSLKDDRNYEYDCARYSSTSSRCLTSDKGCSMASGTKWEMDSILATSHARVKATAFDDSDSEDDALLSQQIFTTSSTSVKHEKRDQSSSTKVRKEKNKTPSKSGQTNSVRNNVNAPLPLHQRTTSQVENRGFEIESDDDLVTESRRVSFQSRPLQESRTTIAIATGTNSALAARVTQPPLLETNNNTVDFGGLDLMSPVASRGRPSVGSAMSSSSARKVKVPTPAIPVANEIGGKLYPDLRNQFIKELIRNAKLMRRATYQKGALDGSIRAINSLALYQFPIRTAEGAQAIKGIGGELIGVLKDAQKAVKKNELPYNPPAGKFASAAAAALVILLDHEAGKTDADRCLSMEDLMMRINKKAHCTTGGRLFNRETDYYLDKQNLDPSWMQVSLLKCLLKRVPSEKVLYCSLDNILHCIKIRKLCSSGFMKERKRKKACTSGLIYELEEVGRQEARHLKARLSQGSIPKGPLRQLAAHTVLEEFGNITIVMDFREGGGGRHKLHEMCGFMDEHEIPYVVRDLKISDYVFFVGDKLVPVLIERKSIEDVASSLHDGRWERQQRNMRKAQYVLGGGDERKCHICYLIEGDIDRTTVHGGFVGRSAYRKVRLRLTNGRALILRR